MLLFGFCLFSPIHSILIKLFASFLLVCSLILTANAQKPTLSIEEIDSLLQLEDQSYMTFRLAFANKALFAGRDFGTNQSLLMPDITYFHKSGLYAELTGLSYSKSTPQYELTYLSAGYTGFVGNLLYSAELSRTFYTQPDPDNPNPLPNGLMLSGSYDIKKVSVNLGYTLMFGSETAHRITFGPSYFQKWTNLGWLDRLSINPSLNLIIGTQSSNYGQIWNSYASNLNPTLGTGTVGAGAINVQTALANLANPNLPPIVRQNILRRLKLAGVNPGANTNTTTTQNYFGLMACDVSLPISATKGDFRLSFTPHLIKPVKLYSSEDISVKLAHYFSLSLTYTLKFGFGI